MKRLLLLNIRTDIDDTALGFTTSWINGLADRCEKVVVITMHAGRLELRPNVEVHSLGGERGTSRFCRLGLFYRAAWRAIRRDRVDACFSHMSPLLLILLWPLSRAARLPMLLWYAHGAVNLQLRLAERLADRCVTSTPSGFRLSSAKLYVLGQGIDTERFHPVKHEDEARQRIISVCRITPTKNLELMIESVGRLGELGITAELEIFGGPVTENDAVYEQQCRQAAAGVRAKASIRFQGPVPHGAIATAYRRGGVFLSLGGQALDKAILEAMASGCLPVSNNESFAAIARAQKLDLLVPAGDSAAIAETLATAISMSSQTRDPLIARCRQIVVEDHSLVKLVDEIILHLDALVAGAGHGGRMAVGAGPA